MAKWETVKLPIEMVDAIEDYIQTEQSKAEGFTSKSQVVVTAVRDFLTKRLQKQKLETVAVSNNYVILVDHKLNSHVVVKLESKKIHCSIDGEINQEKPCMHIFLALLEKTFFNYVKKNSIKFPNFGKDFDINSFETTRLMIDFFDGGEDGDYHALELNEDKKRQKTKKKTSSNVKLDKNKKIKNH